MTGENSSWATREQAKLLLNPEHYRLINALLGAEHSASELAAKLGLPLSRVHYLLGRFEQAGLARVVSVVPRAGRPIKRYRMEGPLYVPFEHTDAATLLELFSSQLLPFMQRFNELLVREMLRTGDRWGVRFEWQEEGATNVSFVPETGSEPPVAESSIATIMPLNLTPERAQAFKRKLQEVLDEFSDGSIQRAPGREPYMLSVLFVAGEMQDSTPMD